MIDLRDELRAAMETKGYTYDRLRKESGVACNPSSLNRKLNGHQGLSAKEARALTRVLGVRAAAVGRVADLAETLGGRVGWGTDKRVGNS